MGGCLSMGSCTISDLRMVVDCCPCMGSVLVFRTHRTAADPGASVGDLSKLFSITLEDKLRCNQSGKFRWGLCR